MLKLTKNWCGKKCLNFLNNFKVKEEFLVTLVRHLILFKNINIIELQQYDLIAGPRAQNLIKQTRSRS